MKKYFKPSTSMMYVTSFNSLCETSSGLNINSNKEIYYGGDGSSLKPM